MKLDFAVIKNLNSTLEFKEKEGESDLRILQQELNGYLERLTQFFPWASERGLEIFGNDEANLKDLEPSCVIWSEEKRKPITWLKGPLVIVRLDKDGVYFESITDEDKDFIQEVFTESTNKTASDLPNVFVQTVKGM